ncbi:uncharacterized protein LY79DRAFT_188781 [Colletotrichum navitas]|uniref:Uncharacterized protein n=1 Tax=Colletotrichum navitas TaxID=681940 RepID=A0AAD8Q0J3_9PEZI|nr:uncharacterized protein LY79DRAFT_188781 [Colletotrichum navitas]KAK1593140.1 hypothetical protein LY79DRAFT_188781 [Colletotrichum navitas]
MARTYLLCSVLYLLGRYVVYGVLTALIHGTHTPTPHHLTWMSILAGQGTSSHEIPGYVLRSVRLRQHNQPTNPSAKPKDKHPHPKVRPSIQHYCLLAYRAVCLRFKLSFSYFQHFYSCSISRTLSLILALGRLPPPISKFAGQSTPHPAAQLACMTLHHPSSTNWVPSLG